MSQEQLAEEIDIDLAVETSGLTKRYGNLVALGGLDLNIPIGSVYALIGPNGAGKTTAFQILATLLEPSSGEAYIFDIDPITHPYEARRVFGYMPDFFGVYDDLKVSEYLLFFAAAHKIPAIRRDKIASDLLELVELSHKKDAFVDSLSRGMKQRLGLARALVHDPKLLILDEPASGLDPRARVELRELIKQLQRMGKTVLISSHILLELEEVCDHVGILEAGQLLAQGPPSEMLANYREAKAYVVRLRDPADAPRLNDVLGASGLVSSARFDDNVCAFAFNGTEEEAADLLSAIIGYGVAVTEFVQERANLEDVFMRITKGIVQ